MTYNLDKTTRTKLQTEFRYIQLKPPINIYSITCLPFSPLSQMSSSVFILWGNRFRRKEMFTDSDHNLCQDHKTLTVQLHDSLFRLIGATVNNESTLDDIKLSDIQRKQPDKIRPLPSVNELHSHDSKRNSASRVNSQPSSHPAC